MNLKSIFGGVAIGKDTSGNIKPSIKGLAVRLADGKFVVKDGEGFLDVAGFVFDGGDKYVFRLPVKEEQIKPDDLLIISDSPFQSLFVTAVKEGTIIGLDPQTSTIVQYVPPKNMFGITFFVKAVNLLGSFADGGTTDVLPMLLLSDGLGGLSGAGAGEDNLSTLLLLQTLGGGQTADMSTMLPFLLLNGNNGNGLETLLLLQTLGLNLGNLGTNESRTAHGKQALPPVGKTNVPEGERWRTESPTKA
jgi:hypothetical protein